jgi:F-type H+-transporting ATPase subunit gamma
MAKTKEIQRRIKSISSTKKITKAMEMVSAAKMRKATEAVLKTRTYANLSWEIILNLSKNSKELHPLLAMRDEVKKVAILVITSNRSLCGGFNTAVLNKVREVTNSETEIILLGKKGWALKNNIVAEFPKADVAFSNSETSTIAKMLVADYLSGKYDKIMVAYTDFKSAARQIPRLKQLLPVDINALDNDLGMAPVTVDVTEYLFEPSTFEVLDRMIPKLIGVQIFQALLESNASEHSARMTAMHQATEAAADMTAELVLYYNKSRQAAITSEIAEISAGANALAE